MNKLTFTHVKEIKSFCENLDTEPDYREVVDNIADGNNDFQVGDYRFIESCSIDEIQKEELLEDNYMLGCFSAWFIADITGLNLHDVAKAQKNESFELLGTLMAQKIDEVQEEYSRLDGYGHHFAHYDHNEHELDVDGSTYHVFRVD